MITFIDEKGTEHSALVAYSVTNAVNGELSVKGTIYANDKVLHGIGRGWRFRLDDEYYRITYAKPNDTGRQIEVEFDAVHQFFYDMSKSMVYTILNGSKPFETYLQAIFSGSGYTYNLETTVGSIRKENFGNKSRLSLFNDIIKAAGLEFSVRGHVIRILKRVGTDLSTIVRKDFNMNELKIEKDINSFVTYQRGLGAWKDDEDHSKGRYETSYESPLSAIYGRIEADPVVDERYKDTGKLLERLKENVDKSYKVSVEIDMEDLSQAGYRISRPNPGDYIMAINETLGFRQKVRIVSFTSEYDVGGNLISRKVVCNDIGTVQRVTSEISHLSRTLTDSIEGSERALKTATKALVSADGKNTNYFGDVKPLDVPKGTLRKGDRLFLTVGDKKQLYFWNGAEWELEPTEFDHEKFDMEFNRNSQEIKKTIQENRQKAIEALQNAGASSSLAQEAKQIGLDSVARLEAFKSQTTSAQTALSGDLTALKRTIANDIRPKQAQAEAEIAKQVEALNKTKNELSGIKSAQATYEETTTRRLAELANVADGKASKSELTQTAEELASKIASVKVGGRNLYALSKNYGIASSSHLTDLELDAFSGEISFRTTGTDPYVGIAASPPKQANDRDGILIPVLEEKQIYVTISNPLFIRNFISFFDKDKKSIKAYKRYKKSSFIISSEDLEGVAFISLCFGCGGTSFKIGDMIKTKIKIEYGTIPTDWSPAPEDQEERISIVESNFKQRADALDAGVSRLTEGLRTKADISALNVTAENIRQSVKSLETNTQNKLDQKLSQAEFEVRAGSIRQEILNATKDKADKTLVIAEAGKLREEFSNLSFSENLFINSEFKNLHDNGTSFVVNDSTYKNLIAPYWHNPYNSGLPNHQNIQHGHFDTDTFKETVFVFDESDGSRHHKSLSTGFEIGKISVGEYYFSTDLYATSQGTKIKFGFYYHKSTGRPGFYSGEKIIQVNEVGNWIRMGTRLTVNDDIDLSKEVLFYIYGYNFTSNSILYLKKPKISKGLIKTDWSPAPEDIDGLITEAKAIFERTAQGLRTDLSAIQEYVNKDGQRQEALQRYTREESAKQATAVRELVEKDYVGKATYQETVRAIENKFEAITNPQNGSIATQIANYKKSVDGRFADITSLIAGKANQTDFQRVKETSQLYERILGNTENGIADKVARMAMTNQLFQVEVSKNENLKTVQSQLAGSWGVHNKNSVNEIIAGFNLAGRNAGIKAETIRLEGNTLADKLTAIDGYFKRLFVGEGTFATLNADVIRTNSITADKLVFNEALANRMVSNEHITNKLVASRAFVNALKAVTIDASQIVTGTLKGDRIYGGTIRGTEINGTTITGNSRMTIGDNGFLRPTQEGGLQINVPETYSASKGVGVQLLGRELGRIPKGMFIYNSPNWNGGNIIGDNTEDILLTVKGRVSLCNLHNGSPVSGVPIISNFEYQNPIRNLYPIRFIGWDPRSNQLYVDDGTGKSGTWWISVDGSTSDKNLKTNIGDTHYNALDFVQKLMFKEFDWKTDKFGYKKPYTNVGLIAQDVEKIDSSLVYKKGETLALDDFRLLNIALKAIQELALENRKLTHRLENLENERRTA